MDLMIERVLERTGLSSLLDQIRQGLAK